MVNMRAASFGMNRLDLPPTTLTGSLGSLLHAGTALVATLATSPFTAVGFVLVGEVGLCGRDELCELGLVLGADVLEGEDRGLLLVHDRAETGLVLDDHVGDAHLAAEGWDEDDQLDGVDVVGDDDKAGLLGLVGVKGRMGRIDLSACVAWGINVYWERGLSGGQTQAGRPVARMLSAGYPS